MESQRKPGKQGKAKRRTKIEQEEDEKMKSQINCSVVMNLDKNFDKMLAVANQTAVYSYNMKDHCWNKPESVGCLYFYTRKVGFRFGFMSMNRKEIHNFVEKFDQESEISYSAPYLMLRVVRNSVPTAIQCIWFYESSQCLEFVEILAKNQFHFENPGKCAMPIFKNILEGPPNNLPKKSVLNGHKPTFAAITAEELENQFFTEAQSSRSALEETASTAKAKLKALTLELKNDLGISGGEANLVKSKAEKPNPTRLPSKLTTDDSRAVFDLSQLQIQPQKMGMQTVEQIENEIGVSRNGSNSSEDSKYEPKPSTSSNASTAGESGRNLPLFNSPEAWEKSKRKITAEDFVGKKLDETSEEMVQELVKNCNPSDLVLVNKKLPGEAGLSLIWQYEATALQRRSVTPSSAAAGNGVGKLSYQSGPDILSKGQLAQAFKYMLETDEDFVDKLHRAYLSSLGANKTSV